MSNSPDKSKNIAAEQQQEPIKKKLTGKERSFLLAYLGAARFNATKAAKLAGYKANSETAFSVIGYQNLRKLHISEEINKFFEEHLMTAEECLARLTNIGRCSIDDVISDHGSWFDLEKARGNGAIQFVKKLKVKRARKEVTSEILEHSGDHEPLKEELESTILHEEIEFEMYDAHDAVKDIGRHHKLFTDNHHLSGELEYVTFEIETGSGNKLSETGAE